MGGLRAAHSYRCPPGPCRQHPVTARCEVEDVLALMGHSSELRLSAACRAASRIR